MEKGGSVCPCCAAYENMVAEEEEMAAAVVRARFGSGTCRFSAWLPSKERCASDSVLVSGAGAGASSLLSSSSLVSSAGSFVRVGWFPGAALEDGAGWCSTSKSSGKSLAAAFLADGEVQCCRCITLIDTLGCFEASQSCWFDFFSFPVIRARALMKRLCARLVLIRLYRAQLDLL